MNQPYLEASIPAPATASAPRTPASMPQYWSITIEDNAETVLSIGHDWLSGRALTDQDEQTILGAAQHLLAFIGYGLPPTSFNPDDDNFSAPEEALKIRDAELAEWKKLRDPAILHANLLRGVPARLTGSQLAHLLGTDAPGHAPQAQEMAMLVRQLAYRLKQLDAKSTLPSGAIDYLQRHGLIGSPLRDESTGEDA